MKSLRYVVLLSVVVMLLASCSGFPPVFPPGTPSAQTSDREAPGRAPEAPAVVETTPPVAPAVETATVITPTVVLEATAAVTTTVSAGEAPATPTEEQVMGANPLVGVKWEWAALLKTRPAAQSVVPDPASYTVSFGADGTLAIQADCNTAAGTYMLENDRVTLRLGPATLVACPPGSLGDTMLNSLSKVGSYLIDGGDLILRLADSSDSMLFRNGGPSTLVAPTPGATEAPSAAATVATETPAAAEAPAPKLTGTVWQWEKFIDVATGKNNLDVNSPELYTVTFEEGGSVAMRADCNRAAGTYTVDGAKLTVAVGPITLAACSARSLSDMFLIDLTSATSLTLADGKLNLDLMADGGRMVFRPAK